MKKLLAIIVVAALVLGFVARSATTQQPKPKNPNLGKLRHVVLFKFKDGTSAEDVKKVEDAFRLLPTKIPTIVGYEWGTNNSPEKHSQGFTHCFFLTFGNAADRDAYLPHPAHKEFGNVLRPHLDKVLVVDYFVQE
jgi:hypothetical protein